MSRTKFRIPVLFLACLAASLPLIAFTVDSQAQTAHRLQLTLNGEANGDRFGATVARIGDINRDGFADFAVGAPQNDGNGLDAGRVYVYLGGPSLSSTPNLILNGANAGDFFGNAISAAGDMNGDGYGDFAVGAPGADVGGTDRGAAYVYFGKSTLVATPDVTMNGINNSEAFGFSLSYADANGDGYSDLIVGAPGAGTNPGKAYLFLGDRIVDAVADATYLGLGAGDRFGFAVAGGSYNAYLQDVIITAPFNDGGGIDAGRWYVSPGARVPNGSSLAAIGTGAAGDTAGASISVGAAGFSWILVGVPGYDAGPAVGRAQLNGANYYGERPGDQFGWSVGLSSDAKFMVIGAPGSPWGTGVGKVYSYGLTGEYSDFAVKGSVPGDRFGWAAATLGDVNGDGFGDFLVGAPQDGTGGSGPGHAYLYDVNRYFVQTPNGGETWNVGAVQTITWAGSMLADVSLSTDGGATYTPLRLRTGGQELNSISFRVPHLATRFGKVRVAPSAGANGQDESDVLFTIQTSVTLLASSASAREGGVALNWKSEPGVGPQGIAGYRLYRLEGAETGTGSRVGPELITGTEFVDAGGSAASRYRLAAVNGLMEEQEIGQLSALPASALLAWPTPYRGGDLHVSFATASGLGGGNADADVAIFDLQGRRVATLFQGRVPAGQHEAAWAGRNARGELVRDGVYFIVARSLDVRTVQKLVVMH